MYKIKQTKLCKPTIFMAAILVSLTALVAIILSTNAQADTNNYAEHVPGEVIACVETDPYFGEIDNSNSGLNQINNQMNSFLSNYNCETLLCFAGNETVYNSVANDVNMITVIDPSDSKTKPAQTRFVKITFDENQKTMSQMIKELESSSFVKYAEPNYLTQICDETDPDISDWQYAYDSESNGSATHNKVGMNVSNWNSSTPNIPQGDNVVVAVIDTGVDYNHPDLITADEVYGNLYNITGIGGQYGYNAGADTSKGESDTDPMDKNSHGTHCSGSIAANWNNSGVSGAANVCSILPVKAADKDGHFIGDGIIRAYGYVIKAKEKNINIVSANNSWTGPIACQYISDLVTKAGEKGIVSVFASGNERTNIDTNPFTATTLQNNPYAIVVNSSNELGHVSTFSNYGLKTTDVYAPGQNIYSTVPSWTDETNNFKTSDIRFMNNSDYNVLDDFENPSGQWKLGYYLDGECQQKITSVTDGQGYLGGKGLYIEGKSDVSPKSIIVTGDYNEIASKKRLALLFKVISRCLYSDKAQCSIYDANNLDAGPITYIGMSAASSEDSYFPISVETSKLKKVDNKFKIAVAFWYFNEDQIMSSTDYYIDKVSVTDKEYPYSYMNGTSMACPACCGIVAVLAANNKTESAEKIVARIKGGTNRKDWLSDKCYTGGIVNLGRSSSTNPDSELDPVVLDAKLVSSSENSSIVKINGYFLGDSSSIVTINGIPATSVVTGNNGNRQELTCYFSSKITGSVSINVNKNGQNLTKYFDLCNNEELLERINLPDPAEFGLFYSEVINDLKYANNDYLYINTMYQSGSKSFIYNINSKQWSLFDYVDKVTKEFVKQGKSPTDVDYLCAKDDIVVYSCKQDNSFVGFAYYNLVNGDVSIDVSNFSVPATFGYYDNQVIYFGGIDGNNNRCVCSYDPISKVFEQISTVDDWGKYPLMYKLEEGKFLLIDIGNPYPQASSFTNDMYLLTISGGLNNQGASVAKLDQQAFPTLITDKTSSKITGHVVVDGKLMMIGPSNVDKDTQGVICDTFVRNIQTQEEVSVPGLLSNTKAYQSTSARSDDYVYTYFMEYSGPAIAKRYVVSPVPPTPDPTPQDDVLAPITTAATGDVVLSILFAIFVTLGIFGFAASRCYSNRTVKTE